MSTTLERRPRDRRPGAPRSRRPNPAASVARLALAALAAALLSAAAPASPYSSSVRVDWPAGVISLEASLDLYAMGIRLPSGRSEAERLLEAAVPDMAMPAVLELGLDSYRSVRDALEDGSLDPVSLRSYLESGRRLSVSLSPDTRTLRGAWEWDLAKLGALFVRHSVPVELKEAWRFAPTRAYSGIVVYAQGRYPVRGEHSDAALTPCLYPRLYDEAMDPLVERNLLLPAALVRWGSVGYAFSADDPEVERRAGTDPLRIIVRQVFGSRRTDAVISEEDALRILGSPENRELIRSGKVVFVIDKP